jgi:cystathionine beta-lyase/cystathionine gamma-synthase
MTKKEKPRYMESYFIHGDNISPRWDYSHHLNPPITESVTFRLENAERGAQGFSCYAKLDEIPEHPIYIYERLDEPTCGMLEDRLAAAERGESALVFSTGMAAISAIACILTEGGDHIVSHDSIYGCTYSLFSNWMPRRGTTTTFVNMCKDPDWTRHIRDNTRFVYFETPVNPTLELIDIEDVCKKVAEVNKSRPEDKKIYTIVDNTFASPFCQRPLEFGVDIVVASMTKHISGFNTCMGGAVIIPKKLYNALLLYRKDFGGSLHGRSAWPILVYGLPTLATRLRHQTSTATELAKYLTNHPKVREVHYPGLETHPQYALAKKQLRSYDGSFAPGALLNFVLKGKPEEAKKKGTKLIDWLAKNAINYTLAVSLGCVKTLIEHPSSMTHSAIPLEEQLKGGIEPGGIRLSVGLEDKDMLIEELEAGLEKI